MSKIVRADYMFPAMAGMFLTLPGRKNVLDTPVEYDHRTGLLQQCDATGLYVLLDSAGVTHSISQAAAKEFVASIKGVG